MIYCIVAVGTGAPERTSAPAEFKAECAFVFRHPVLGTGLAAGLPAAVAAAALTLLSPAFRRARMEPV